MIKRKTYLGKVSWPPNRQACYVRVSISQEDGIPLCIKAAFSDFDRRDLVKNAWVEVVRTNPNDARRYKVVRLMKEVPPSCSRTVHFDLETRDAGGFRNEVSYWTNEGIKTMDMSKDRVRLWVGPRYLQQSRFYRVLNRAFGLHEEDARGMYRKNDGFWIVCRPSQFARFMIYRNEAGIENGFMDLKAELVQAKDKTDVYALLAEKAGITRDQAKRVSYALCYSGPEEIVKRLKPVPFVPVEIDVSKNAAR